jgi:alpha-tubulin suppressor-like RCC1 family protein
VPTAQIATIDSGGQLLTWGINAPYHIDAIPNLNNVGVVQIAMGEHHALALTANGTVVGWGTNLRGELTIPTTLNNVVQIAVGQYHSVALKNNGTVVMWGDAAALIPPTGGSLTGVVQIVAGNNHTILLKSTGQINVYGAPEAQAVPSILSSKVIVAVAAGGINSLALGNDGAVYQWGDSSLQLPARVSGSVTRIFASGNVYAALRSDGELYLWGVVGTLVSSGNATLISNATSGCPCMSIPSMSGLVNVNQSQWGIILAKRSGQRQVLPHQSAAVPAGIPLGALRMSTHQSHNFGIAIIPFSRTVTTMTPTPNTQLSMRAANEFNTLGVVSVWGGNSAIQSIPADATDKLVQISAGYRHMVALRPDGVVLAWGDNAFGQLNVPASITTSRPYTDTTKVIALASGAYHTLAMRANGSILAWGSNEDKQITIPPLTTVAQIAAGVRHSVVLQSNGSIVSWGDNTYGQLNAPYISGVVKIAAAGWHTVALLRNGTVVAWGRDNYAQTQVSGYTRVIDIAAAQENTVLLLQTGQIVVIGKNTQEQLYAPIGNYQRIGAGANHILAINSDGKVLGWGLNSNGQTTIPNELLFPFQVVGGSNFSAALVQAIDKPENTPIRSTATIPSLPMIATTMPEANRGNYIVLANGLKTDPISFSGSNITLAAGITSTLDIAGNMTFIRDANTQLCNLPSALATQIFQQGIGEFVVTLYKNHVVRVWSICNWNNEAISYDELIPTAFQQNVAEISVRGPHIMVLTIDGRIWSNLFNLTQRTNINHIAAGRNFAAILLNDNTIEVVAQDNLDGILNIPPSATTLTEISAGDYHILALRSDGRPVSWGANNHDEGQADIPFAAQKNVIAIATGENQSMALLNTGSAVAWGDYPANTIDNLNIVNTNYYVTGISTGDRRIAVNILSRPVILSPTTIPSATKAIIPTLTPHVLSNVIAGGLLGWYNMSDFQPIGIFNSTGITFSCTATTNCPSTLPNETTALQFINSRGDELVSSGLSSGNITLDNQPFTVRAVIRRDTLNRNEVIMSLGQPGIANKYLTMGIDRENRPFCNFYGSDLRSANWYSDLTWHQYACSYDPISRVRTLWRDTAIIAQDVVLAGFTPGSARIIIGRRYDTMEGFTGTLSSFEIINHVVTQSEMHDPTSIASTDKIARLQIETLMKSISPNRATIRCGGDNGLCANFAIPRVGKSHDDRAAIFQNNQLNLALQPAPASFTIAYWAAPDNYALPAIIASRLNSDNTGLYMGFDQTTDGEESTTPQVFCKWQLNPSNTTIALNITETFNNWTHYACSYDAVKSELAFYVNAQLVGRQSVPTQSLGNSIKVGHNSTSEYFNEMWYRGLLDDLMIYDHALSSGTLIFIYNMTNPPVPVTPPTAITCSPACTPTVTFTRTTVPSATTAYLSRTARPATFTPTNLRIPTFTFTPSRTFTASLTRTATRTPIYTSTPTATVPSRTPSNTYTRTRTHTRTPLYITRTMLIVRSPTFYIQTQTALVGISLTQTAQALLPTYTATVTLTASAYPIPTDATQQPTAYPVPNSN